MTTIQCSLQVRMTGGHSLGMAKGYTCSLYALGRTYSHIKAYELSLIPTSKENVYRTIVGGHAFMLGGTLLLPHPSCSMCLSV